LGAEYLLEIEENLKPKVFALGGINCSTLPFIRETGVGGVAFSRAALDNGFIQQINNEQTKRNQG